MRSTRIIKWWERWRCWSWQWVSPMDVILNATSNFVMELWMNDISKNESMHDHTYDRYRNLSGLKFEIDDCLVVVYRVQLREPVESIAELGPPSVTTMRVGKKIIRHEHDRMVHERYQSEAPHKPKRLYKEIIDAR